MDFFVSVTGMPFAIDIWVQKTRLAAARYIAGLGLQDRLLYNSITPWDEDIDDAVKGIIAGGDDAVWPGCDIWPTVPRQNMEALVVAVRKYGKRPQ